MARRRAAAAKRRVVPVRERYTFLGAWPYWLLLVGALAADHRGRRATPGTVARARTAGVDLVILQDGSASMHVADVAPDRWRRSMRFVRALAESLRWEGDRLALALFARIAAPQVRLTRDPNAFFFFLDHIEHASPFPLKDDTTWDTNIELGIYWGARLIERDAELNGASANSKAFVLISDGQAWSGEVDKALGIARERAIPIYVVGVGSERGGYIPEPERSRARPRRPSPPSPIHSRLDRRSLITIATAGGGSYFDLGSNRDRIARKHHRLLGSPPSRSSRRRAERPGPLLALPRRRRRSSRQPRRCS